VLPYPNPDLTCAPQAASYAANGVKHCVRPMDMAGRSAGLILRRINPQVPEGGNECIIYMHHECIIYMMCSGLLLLAALSFDRQCCLLDMAIQCADRRPRRRC
jgi:hypothetical protein